LRQKIGIPAPERVESTFRGDGFRQQSILVAQQYRSLAKRCRKRI
jgi:hypothetical protein